MKKRPASPKSIAPVAAPEAPQVQASIPWVYGVTGLVGLIGLGLTTWAAWPGTLTGWELSLFKAINGVHAPAWLTTLIAKPLSNAVWGLVGLSIVALLVPRLRWKAWQYAVPGGGTWVVAAGIEQVVGRLRPEALIGHEAVMRASQGGAGFPSGHVAVLTAMLLTLFPWVRWYWKAVIVLCIIAEAWSRVFLGVHAPLDVLAGAALGLLAVSVIRLVPANWRRIFFLH